MSFLNSILHEWGTFVSPRFCSGFDIIFRPERKKQKLSLDRYRLSHIMIIFYFYFERAIMFLNVIY